MNSHCIFDLGIPFHFLQNTWLSVMSIWIHTKTNQHGQAILDGKHNIANLNRMGTFLTKKMTKTQFWHDSEKAESQDYESNFS